ncbi:MAG: DUF4367 domain-containing protein [Lachnospiraceae bacterium]|nr:DUF4367 domain-containing protein [Lachnospiraceae bacterium]
MTSNTEKDKIAEEALRDYITIVEKAESDELMRFMDDNYKPMEKKAAAERKYVDVDKMSGSGSGMSKVLRYAAVLVLAVTVISIVVPVQEVSAWVVWKFDAIFGEEDDHTVINPVDENDYIKYYLTEVPKGYEVHNTITNENQTLIEYTNSNGNYIVFTQVKYDMFKANTDNEHREQKHEIINDFETLVSIGKDDCYFEIIADNVVITVQTNADYEIGKEFIKSLKEL